MAKNNPLPRAARSTVCPFVPGESWDDRHARRKTTANTMIADLEAWCRGKGGLLSLHNDAAHYKLRFPGLLVEWWPETGRVVRNQNWGGPVKSHDVHQLVHRVEKWLRKAKTTEVDAHSVAVDAAQREANRLISTYPGGVLEEVIALLKQHQS